MARWITREAYPGTHYPFYNSHCSNCGYKTTNVLPEWGNRCPKCGATMEGDSMAEYTGNFFTIENSRVFNGDTINVLEYRDKSGKYRTTCIRCGKPLRYHWFTIQTAEDDAVYGDIGAECVKKLT